MTIDRTQRHRRAFLASAGRASKALAAMSLLRASPGILAPSAALFPTAGKAGALLVQPHEISSRNGVLDAMLTAAPGTVRRGTVSIPGFLYNNAYLPPLLRIRLGDTMRISLRNDLPEDPSNLHFHGMGVSPQGNSDNVFVHVHPGQVFQYEVNIPVHGRQGPGLFWYQPHAHGGGRETDARWHVRRARRRWVCELLRRSEARTTKSFRQPGPAPTSATFPRPNCTCWTPGTSLSKISSMLWRR